MWNAVYSPLCDRATACHSKLLVPLILIFSAKHASCAGCDAGLFGPPSPRLLLIHTEYPNEIQDVKAKLLATDAFKAVDTCDASAEQVCTADHIRSYDAALVWVSAKSGKYFSSSELGDVLADYWDQ